MLLKQKMVLSYLFCIIFAFLPLIYYMNVHAKQITMNTSEKNISDLIDSKAIEISQWLNQRISELRVIEQHPDVKNVDIEKIKSYIGNLNTLLQTHYGNLAETFAIGSTNGLGWINDKKTIDVSEREYFKKAMSQNYEYVISRPVISKFDNTPIFLICYPIINNGEKVGFINGAINLNKMVEIVSKIDIYNGNSWIMDSEGNIYSPFEKNYSKVNSTVNLFNEIKAICDYEHSGNIKYTDKNKNNKSIFFSEIPLTNGWILCTEIDNSEIYAQTNNILNVIVSICITMIILTFIISTVISSTITKPILQLERAMEKVSNGNLNSTFDYYGKDEIASLSKSFNNMTKKIQLLLEEIMNVQEQKRHAELKVLQSQINPHFLYNTLDTLQWKALEKNAFEIADMVNSLSKIFRISLSDGRELIPISDEVEHAKSYLEIQKIRYNDILNYKLEVDEKTNDRLIPKLIIQPLIENAIYHGIKASNKIGNIEINISEKDNNINIVIVDNGVGIDSENLKKIQNNLTERIQTDNYGLYSVYERLNLWYKGRAKMSIVSNLNIGTTVTVEIPI